MLLLDDPVEDVDVERVFSPVEAVRVATRGLVILFLSSSLADEDLASVLGSKCARELKLLRLPSGYSFASLSFLDERRFSSFEFTLTRLGVEHISQFSVIFGSDVIVNSVTFE